MNIAKMLIASLLVLTISWYESIFLLVLVGYLLVRGLLIDGMMLLSSKPSYPQQEIHIHGGPAELFSPGYGHIQLQGELGKKEE